jgi:signal transduction histidine kinase
LIRQLVIILLDNAVKYTPEGGRIEVCLEKGYRLKVIDSGIGIPTEARDQIFARFFRLDKARSRSSANVTGGAGLGLSIARWIAEVHGGSVQLESSTPGRGSVFVVSLPGTHAEPQAAAPVRIENGASVEAPPSAR